MPFYLITLITLLVTLSLTACAAHPVAASGAPRTSSGIDIALTSVFVDDPAKAHAFYTDVLGFRSKEFNPEAYLAIVVSAENPAGPALLLEPRGASFAKEYQEKVFEAGLPIIVFSVHDLTQTISDLKTKGVKFRDDLTKKEWGLENMLEDTCGNLIMLQQADGES